MKVPEHPLLKRVASAAESLSAAFHERFALCPLIGTSQDCCVYDALADGRIPVVISDALGLPLADRIDYPSFLFQIGTCASELDLLRGIDRLPERDTCKMLEAGRAAWERHFRDEHSRVLPQLSDVAFPARSADGRLLREPERMRYAWRSLRGRVLIFGAGKYLRRLMQATGGRNGPEVVGIADDAAEEPSELYGLTLASGTYFQRSEFDSVFLATDRHEDLFATRVGELYGEGVPLLRPSALMDGLSEAGDDEESCCVQRVPPPARYPAKLEGVVVCVHYGDFLSWSLPRNVRHFDRFAVVTSPEDEQTQSIAKACGAELVISERFREGGAVFNKGKMLNDGFEQLAMDGWVLVTDADVMFRPGFRRRLFSRLLNERSLYYATRFNTPAERREGWMTRWFARPQCFAELAFDDPGMDQMPSGYFQLMHGSCGQRYSEDFPSAGEVDYEFQERWPVSHRVLLPEGVVHIAHGTPASNWKGRTSEALMPNPGLARTLALHSYNHLRHKGMEGESPRGPARELRERIRGAMH